MSNIKVNLTARKNKIVYAKKKLIVSLKAITLAVVKIIK
tara:strand:+ start:12635 stop:12751 length:117 start_codon:yes stop_codon:yes gene_type:complete